MKKIWIATFCLVLTLGAKAQDKENITRACLDYIEGFYEGDSTKLVRSVQPALHKYGFWKDKTTAKYSPDGYMTFQQAKKLRKQRSGKKEFCKGRCAEVSCCSRYTKCHCFSKGYRLVGS